MCYASSPGALSRLGVLWGALSLATLLTAFLSNVWLFTREPVRLPNSDIATTITFKIGLWRVCPTVNRPNSTHPTPNPACTLIKYSTWDEVEYKDLGVWTPLDFTPAFISRMRLSTPFEAAGVVLMLVATLFAMLGHCNGDHKTLVACGLYILAGLSLGGGLVIFASVLSDAYMERPQNRPQLTLGSSTFNGQGYASTTAAFTNSNISFDYRYGWSFFAAGAAFIMAEMAAVLTMTAYVRRFPTIEDMVRVMVPGAERRLRPRKHSSMHLASECLVQSGSASAASSSGNVISSSTSIGTLRRGQNGGGGSGGGRSNGPPGIWAGAEYFSSKSENLVASDLDGVDGPLLLTAAPDVCVSNPVDEEAAATVAAVAKDGTITTSTMGTGVGSLGVKTIVAPSTCTVTTTSHSEHAQPHQSTAVTVPITLVTRPAAATIFTHSHQHSGLVPPPSRFSTLQPPKRRPIAVSSFTALESYDVAIPPHGHAPVNTSTVNKIAWSNSEV